MKCDKIGCPYHACMSDDCQRKVVTQQGYKYSIPAFCGADVDAEVKLALSNNIGDVITPRWSQTKTTKNYERSMLLNRCIWACSSEKQAAQRCSQFCQKFESN